MGRDKNSSATTPNGFTVGIDSTHVPSERSRARGSVWHWLGKEFKIRSPRIGWVRLLAQLFVLRSGEAVIASSSEPNETNGYLAAHVNRLIASLRHWTGRNLLDVDSPSVEQARQLFHAPFVVLSHNQTSDPILNYANLVGLRLFE